MIPDPVKLDPEQKKKFQKALDWFQFNGFLENPSWVQEAAVLALKVILGQKKLDQTQDK